MKLGSEEGRHLLTESLNTKIYPPYVKHLYIGGYLFTTVYNRWGLY